MSSMYPALGRRNNLLRSMRAQSASFDRSGVYEPEIDRSSLYMLPMRARFWPGTDRLAGDEWQYWYGDINIPEELSRPRRRPSCLQDEAKLNESMLRDMRLKRGESEMSYARGSSAANLESAASAAEQSMGHASRARNLRSSSVSRLQATRDSMERDSRAFRASSMSRRALSPAIEDLYGDLEIPEVLTRPRRRPMSLQREEPAAGGYLSKLESDLDLDSELHSAAASRASKYLRSLKSSSMQQTTTETTETRRSARGRSALRAGSEVADYLGVDTSRVYVPRWLENHPIPDPPSHRPPPSEVWPEKRPFYDLKNDYDAMLSYMGVTKELKKAVTCA